MDITQTDVPDRIEQLVQEQRLPGLAVGIVRDQELIWSSGFGYANIERQIPPDQSTISRIASITKTFTATAIMQLRDEGLLQLDDPLVEHLPEFSAVTARAGTVEGVTIRRLLSHRSGLVTESPFLSWDNLEWPSREAMLEALARTEIAIPQDSAFKYSNLAFGLLGEVISRLSDRPYVDYMQAEILGPLGLQSSKFALTNDLEERMAVGYSHAPYADDYEVAPCAPLNGVSACGQLHSPVSDLAKWISLQFRTTQDERSGDQILRATSIEEMHRPQYLEADWSTAYCLGWRAQRKGNNVYHEHGGGIHGFASHVAFSKTHKLGLVALANVWPHAGLPNISFEILESLSVESSRDAPEPCLISKPPSELAQFLGQYEATPSIPLTIVFENGELRFQTPPVGTYTLHAPARLEETATPGTFIVRGGRGAGEEVAFERNEAGDVSRIALGGFVYRKLSARG